MTFALGWTSFETDPHHPLAIASALAMVVLLAVGWFSAVANPRWERFNRALWTAGAATLLVHILLAFWLVHGWSHEAAVERVREVGGYGAGIAVNYAFAMVWVADAAWWWLRPISRARRPHWIAWTIHGFMAFVLVNATAIFGSAERRTIYVATLSLLLLAALAIRTLRSRES